MSVVFLGIGSNVGDREKNVSEAVLRIEEEGISVLSRSSFYVTRPEEGPAQEDYLNGVLKVWTEKPPADLLDTLKHIEKRMGRKAAVKNFPRIIDIDILLYGNRIVQTPRLVIPHARMHERAFVLRPLADLAPDYVHPVLGLNVNELLERVDQSGVLKIDERITC